MIETIAQAKQQGKVRFVGFTGHKDPAIHLKMLAHDFPFNSCPMPPGVYEATFRSFEQNVLPELNRRQIAPIWSIHFGSSHGTISEGALTIAL